jgi:preprotein translocase subunit YajC
MLLAAAKASTSHSNYTFLIIIVVAYAAFFFFWWRPRNAKNKAARVQARQVDVGDKVQTVGGLIGTITDIDEHNVVTLQTPEGHKLHFLRAAIAQRYHEPVSEPPDESSDDAPTDGDSH